MNDRNEAANTASCEIVITREFDAPRDDVFDAFTGEHIARWWGPNGFTTTIYEMDVRPGGIWRYMMHGPDGTDYPNKIVYEEVKKPECLTYAHGSDDGEPAHFHVTVNFTEQGGKTVITMKMLFPTAEARDKTVEFGAIEGGNQTLGRLEKYLKGEKSQ